MPNNMTDSELDEWYQRHDGKTGEGRDELIRRLIDEVRRLRAQAGPPCDLCGQPARTTVKVLQRWSARCDEHTQ